MRFVPLNLKWLLEQIETGQLGLAHVKPTGTDDWALFTATTGQWTEFLKEYAAKPAAFDEEHSYVLKQRPPKPSL